MKDETNGVTKFKSSNSPLVTAVIVFAPESTQQLLHQSRGSWDVINTSESASVSTLLHLLPQPLVPLPPSPTFSQIPLP
jgi:hypothetical protein